MLLETYSPSAPNSVTKTKGKKMRVLGETKCAGVGDARPFLSGYRCKCVQNRLDTIRCACRIYEVCIEHRPRRAGRACTRCMCRRDFVFSILNTSFSTHDCAYIRNDVMDFKAVRGGD
jgi:hypothetical protein